MIDPLHASWITHFLLAQPSVDVDDRILQSLLTILPFPSADPLLRKCLLLLRLRSDDAVSELSLETLELLEDLDDGKGATLPALAAAYAAVAVNCAVLRLKEGDDFKEAVGRVCRRIDDMVRGGAGLQSAELEKWKKVLKKALRDESVRKLVRSADTKKKAEDAVKAYVNQASQEIGRPMLEVAARILSSRRTGMVAGGTKASATGECGIPVLETAAESLVSGRIGEGDGRTDANANAGTEEARENKGVAREHRSSTEGLYPCDNLPHIPSPDVVKVKEALRTNCATLRAVVTDPLPDSIAVASLLNFSGFTSAEPNDSELPRTLDRPSSRISDHYSAGPSNKMEDVAPTRKAVTGIVDDRTNAGQVKFSLMDRNPTAHTIEWGDESVELPSEGSEDALKNIRLPSPRKRKIAPLNLSKVAEFTRRRKKKWWTELEENVLREAVAKYGAGSWKFILNCHRTVFEGRTEVDLKDKWRNMTRYR